MLTALPLASGAGLLVYLIASFSLRVGFAIALVLGGVATASVWRRTPVGARPVLRRRALVGVGCGLVATAAYDLVRLALWKGLGTSFDPFAANDRFGALLAGSSASGPVRTTVGMLFHLLNGVGFAVAYVVAVRRPGIVTGLAWAAMLESLTLVLYPSGLGINMSQEFAGVSIAGHVAYGVVLGRGSAALLDAGKLA